MNSNDTLSDILAHTGKSKLDKFIKEYARDNEPFRKALLEEFSPKPKAVPSKTREKRAEEYVKLIKKAFNTSSGSRPYGRYRGYYDDFGFDAEEVREKLEKVIEKARFFTRHDNMDEAVLIAQKMIETIPDLWESNFDYEGDVQVMYDEAIDLLQEMLEENSLSKEQTESLFSWFEKEIVDKKHEHVGLNTSLEVLESCFKSRVAGGFARVLRIIEQRIANEEDYKKEYAIIEKIQLLEENGRDEEADNTISKFLDYPGIRKIRLKRFLDAGQSKDAIQLLNEGIKIAKKKQHAGTVNSWLNELLIVYEQLNDRDKIMQVTRELFSQGSDQQKHYRTLKKITPKNEWPAMLEWILKNISSTSYFGINDLKATIYIEHERWDDLWKLCQKGGITVIMDYEKKLRPRFEKELLDQYRAYVQQQATIADKGAYARVAKTLIRMKSFENGPSVVRQLVMHYRQIYKRRPCMMQELDRVKIRDEQ